MARFMLILAACIFAFSGLALADETGHATAHVFVDVNPNIAVSVLTPNVDLGTIQMGTFPGIFIFRVDANVEMVALWVEATYLYKGNDPFDPLVDPIILAREVGATIEPTNANPVEGNSNIVPFLETVDYNGFTAWLSDQMEFESSQPGYFSQDVTLTVAWDQPDPEKPQGEYSGWVIFYASVGQL
jgi:hypothetical protein